MSAERNDHSAWPLLSMQHLAVIQVAVSGFKSLRCSALLCCSASAMSSYSDPPETESRIAQFKLHVFLQWQHVTHTLACMLQCLCLAVYRIIPPEGEVAMRSDALMSCLCNIQVIFGFGVGGEYPIASSSAAERAEADKQLQFKRGETVILVFAMQVSILCYACMMSGQSNQLQAG